ncbi:hypothetical protein GCM10010918_27100 [Paenibacillus radicis (ex Gao et al. 2016)]|uniref:Uncharacterized protein n=1 Tax=Paenibacillus radicis (ex Gao et al. 2016) TaxID=1737354 RepID=A0A917M0Q3_9BACL|nr:hypothetical protein GCM10010918_27100 [Paenibacillus radicis (ex Gao et al. 2016)]
MADPDDCFSSFYAGIFTRFIYNRLDVPKDRFSSDIIRFSKFIFTSFGQGVQSRGYVAGVPDDEGISCSIDSAALFGDLWGRIYTI